MIPSFDVVIVFGIPAYPSAPTATNNEPFQATAFPVKLELRPVHVIPPSDDVAIIPPTATHNPDVHTDLAFIVSVVKSPDTFNPPVNVVAPPTLSVPVIVSFVTCKLLKPEILETFNPPVNVVTPPTRSVPVIVSSAICKLVRPETLETFNPPVNVVAPTWSVPAMVVLESVDVPVTFNPPDNVVDDVTLRVPTTVLPLLAISPINVL